MGHAETMRMAMACGMGMKRRVIGDKIATEMTSASSFATRHRAFARRNVAPMKNASRGECVQRGVAPLHKY